MNEIATEQVLATVAQTIREVIGEDWALDLEIGLETPFGDEIELESIEFVALGERLTQHYGQRLDFPGWLSAMDLDTIIALRVGQLVEHIVRCTSELATA